jgi:hypothetical protein
VHEQSQADAPLPEGADDAANHVGREKKIGNPMIARLLRSTKRIVEERAWEGGMVWYPDAMLRRSSPSKLAKRVFPNLGTPAAQTCALAIGSYIGKPVSEDQARTWLAKEIDERLDKFVIGARNKIDEVRLVVTENKIDVRAERPDMTRKTVGPVPWGTRL